MDYPDNFQTPAFPAGKRIAISRIMAIWTLIVFLLIIFLCGILLWSSKSERMSPVMIASDNMTGEWSIIDRNSNNNEYPASRTMQEYVVGNFTANWFRVSEENTENIDAWKKCDRTDCISGDTLTFGTHSCAIYCSTGEDVFSRFTYDVIPYYQSLVGSGEIWVTDIKNMIIMPAGNISENGGTWRVLATIVSSKTGPFKVEIFVKVALNKVNYPQTMGFYIAGFNAYNISE